MSSTKREFAIRSVVSIFAALAILGAPVAAARIIFATDIYQIPASTVNIDSDNTGAGTNVSIIANQGLDPAGTIRYNSTSKLWELSNNGGVFQAILTAASSFMQGGNSFGATGVLGTADNNPMTFITNGAERMRIDTAGNVGIGATTVPTSKRLTVSNTAAPTFTAGGNGMGVSMSGGGGIYMKNSTDNVEGKFEAYGGAVQVGVSGTVQAPLLLSYDGSFEGARLATNGNFGVGTNNPQTRLDALGSAAGVLGLARLQNNVAAAVNSGASMLFAANRTTGGMTTVASIQGLITDISNTTYKGMLQFMTSDGAAPAERMRIDNAGRVGINTTSLVDKATITESDATDSTSSLRLAFTQLTNAANIAGQALNIFVTPSGNAGDTIRGILVNDITPTASTERAVEIGNGYDSDIVFNNPVPNVQAPNNFQMTLNNATTQVGAINQPNNNFGAYAEMGGFMNMASYVGVEFSRDDADINADGNQVWGDANQLGVDENSNCVWSVLNDVAGGIGRSTVNAANSACLAYHSSAAADAQLEFAAANTPMLITKAKPSNVGANDKIWVGMSSLAQAQTTSPPTGIYFTNNGGANWVGVTSNGGTATTVPCGVAVSTTNFAVLKIEVRSTTDVRFYVDNNASDGINWTSCGTSTTNIPTAALTSTIMNTSTTAGRTLDIDYFRVWQN